MDKTFNGYLETVFSEENPQILDDDMPDKFDDWLTELQADDFIKYGDEFKQQ